MARRKQPGKTPEEQAENRRKGQARRKARNQRRGEQRQKRPPKDGGVRRGFSDEFDELIDWMRELGIADGPKWKELEDALGPLRTPGRGRRGDPFENPFVNRSVAVDNPLSALLQGIGQLAQRGQIPGFTGDPKQQNVLRAMGEGGKARWGDPDGDPELGHDPTIEREMARWWGENVPPVAELPQGRALNLPPHPSEGAIPNEDVPTGRRQGDPPRGLEMPHPNVPDWEFEDPPDLDPRMPPNMNMNIDPELLRRLIILSGGAAGAGALGALAAGASRVPAVAAGLEFLPEFIESRRAAGGQLSPEELLRSGRGIRA